MEFYDKDVVLETERLILRVLREEDTSAFFHQISHDKGVLRYYIAPYVEEEEGFSIDSILNFYERTRRYAFAIVLKDSGEMIGMINQCSGHDKTFRNIELGYAIGSSYWYQGYVAEALRAVIDFLFSRGGVHKIHCSAITENTASIAVMKKCGMIYEGRKIDEIFWHDRYWDTDTYYCLAPDVPCGTSYGND